MCQTSTQKCIYLSEIDNLLVTQRGLSSSKLRVFNDRNEVSVLQRSMMNEVDHTRLKFTTQLNQEGSLVEHGTKRKKSTFDKSP